MPPRLAQCAMPCRATIISSPAIPRNSRKLFWRPPPPGFDERNCFAFGHRLAAVLAVSSYQRRRELELDDLASQRWPSRTSHQRTETGCRTQVPPASTESGAEASIVRRAASLLPAGIAPADSARGPRSRGGDHEGPACTRERHLTRPISSTQNVAPWHTLLPNGGFADLTCNPPHVSTLKWARGTET